MREKLRVVGDMIVIRPNKVDEKTASGIIIPDTAKQKSQRGEVIATGKAPTIPEEERAQVGDQVLYGKFTGTELAIEGDTQIIMKQSDILSFIERSE